MLVNNDIHLFSRFFLQMFYFFLFLIIKRCNDILLFVKLLCLKTLIILNPLEDENGLISIKENRKEK